MQNTPGRIGHKKTDPFTESNEKILPVRRFKKESGPTGREIEETKPELLGDLSDVRRLLGPGTRLERCRVSRSGQKTKKRESCEDPRPL